MASTKLGDMAIVLGAGIGGLASAAALSPRFERVIVLERDLLPATAVSRDGTPQARHVHALLAGGERALNELLPGFTERLGADGAVPYRAGLDVIVERPGFDPFPVRDLGFGAHAMSRPLIERSLRRSVRALPNVEVRDGCRVQPLRAEGGVVRGVSVQAEGAAPHVLPASLVVDATGRGAPTLELLEALGHMMPVETSIGVDMRYATGTFEMPPRRSGDWIGMLHYPLAPQSARGAIVLPMEEGRWIITLAGRFGDTLPTDRDGLLAFLRGLRTPTLYEALRNAEPVGGIVRYAFPASTRRHFEALPSFPGGLLPIADALCRFNPVYGQGMSVAAQEACMLRRLLAESAEADVAAGELARMFFREVQGAIETPWTMAALPDFIYPDTRGERPADLGARLQFARALLQVAAKDPDVHRLMAEVQHLLKPQSAYRDPALMQRVMAEMGR